MTPIRFLYFTFGLVLLANQAYGQAHLFAGPNVDWVRAPSLLGTVEPQFGYRFGSEITILRDLRIDSLDLHLQLSFDRLGYRQALADSTYRVDFTYFTVSPGVRYAPNRFLTTSFNLDLMFLFLARFREVDANTTVGVINTYQNFGLALRSELVLWSHRLMSPYLSFSHFLLPALKYPRIDAAGNFNGTIRDIWHRTLSIGIRLRL